MTLLAREFIATMILAVPPKVEAQRGGGGPSATCRPADDALTPRCPSSAIRVECTAFVLGNARQTFSLP